MNIHAKRMGRMQKHIYGGVQLSLDDLGQALLQAHVPQELVALILSIHAQARVQVQHCGHSQEVQTKQGILQGSGLSPLLWSLYSGFLLKDMHGTGGRRGEKQHNIC